jgi:hypothetical protein
VWTNVRAIWDLRDSSHVEYNPAPNPVSLSQESLATITSDEYVVAEKTDGVRYSLLLCTDPSQDERPVAVLMDRSCNKWALPGVKAPRNLFTECSLFDGELVQCISRPDKWEYLVVQLLHGVHQRVQVVARQSRLGAHRDGCPANGVGEEAMDHFISVRVRHLALGSSADVDHKPQPNNARTLRETLLNIEENITMRILINTLVKGDPAPPPRISKTVPTATTTTAAVPAATITAISDHL